MLKVLPTVASGRSHRNAPRHQACPTYGRGWIKRTPLRRELIRGHLCTHDELTSTEIVEVPVLDESFDQIRAQEVCCGTPREWRGAFREEI